jgi:MFS family permease
MVGGGGLYREILRVRDARALIGASAVSQAGDWLYNAVLLGYVYAATGSAGWVGAATIFRLLPWVVLIPVGGMLADRYDKRTVLLLGDTARCVLMLGLAVVVASEGPVVVVLVLTMLASVAGSAERPAAIALLPRLVGESRLGPANALLHTVQEIGVVLGPAIGAALLLVAPDYAAFLVNAGSFAFSAALISKIRRRAGAAAATDSGGAGQQFRRGLRIAWSTRFVVPLILVVAMAELVYGAQTVQLVVYGVTELDLGSGGYGWLLAALGVGGVLSAVVNGRLAAGTLVSAVVSVSAALYCATQLVYAATDVVAVAVLGTVVGGAGFVTCEVVAETALARVVPDDTLGRVLGVMQGVSIAAMLAGAALAPVLINVTSLSTSFAVLGVATLVVVFGSRAALGGLDALSRERAETLASRVAVIDRLPLVTGVPRLVLEQLARSSQLVPLPPGVDVVVEGAPAHAFYAVLDGGVVVHHDGTAIAHLGAGDYFGERGLLDEAPRNATVTTEEQSSLLRVEGDVFLDILQTVSTLQSTVTRVSSSRHGSRSRGALVDDPAWSTA